MNIKIKLNAYATSYSGISAKDFPSGSEEPSKDFLSKLTFSPYSDMERVGWLKIGDVEANLNLVDLTEVLKRSNQQIEDQIKNVQKQAELKIESLKKLMIVA